ncbi:Beta-glucosidase 22 [Acorus calamus]|uniref:Beta-glucosidase 22 n=1 Tax=Acorus calamus TaxID=4465 RepID=A0AAV9F319_ACOCL|nr:Beta-glucosidase 22 [Acorus calamus]
MNKKENSSDLSLSKTASEGHAQKKSHREEARTGSFYDHNCSWWRIYWKNQCSCLDDYIKLGPLRSQEAIILKLGTWDSSSKEEMERIPCENIVLHLLILLASLAFHLVSCAKITTSLSRHEFPPGFIFGAGSSAYQIEGAAAEDGRTPSVWDTYAHEGKGFLISLTGKNMDKSTADVTADQYHKYKEDVKLMHDMGLDAYRFSISWSRLIPGGRGPINLKGLEYYNNLINELLKYGIDAHVTLNHFDLPQALEDEYEGTLSPRIMFLDPLIYGDYPAVMRKNIGSRLPSFRPDESEQLKGSFDFIGLNHYTVMHMKDVTGSSDTYGSAYLADISATIACYGEFNLNSTNDADEGINDAERTDYLEAYIKSMLPSIRDGSNIKGYFVWSMLDSFELVFGYTNHYGLYHIDFSGQDRQRQPRQSAHWYTSFLKNSGRGGSRNSDSI